MDSWSKIEVEYITTQTSYRKLAKKYGVSERTLSDYAKKHGWREKRAEYCHTTVADAVKRVSKLEAIDLAMEIETVHGLSQVMSAALKDPAQFRRYLVEVTEYSEKGFPVLKETRERVMKRVDVKAVKDAAQAMQAIEKMLRSLHSILTYQEREEMRMAKKRLKLEERKVEIAERAQPQAREELESGGIVIVGIDEAASAEEVDV